MLMTVHFNWVESLLFLFTSKFSLELVAMDTPLEVSAVQMVYLYSIDLTDRMSTCAANKQLSSAIIRIGTESSSIPSGV